MTAAPKRVQMTRNKPWRDKHPDAVIVARPTKWGNPVRITRERSAHQNRVMYRVHGSPIDVNGGPSYSLIETARFFAAKFFKWDLLNDRYGGRYPSLDDIRRELAGKDLACWCPLVDAEGNRVPCHADVLLDLAAGEEPHV